MWEPFQVQVCRHLYSVRSVLGADVCLDVCDSKRLSCKYVKRPRREADRDLNLVRAFFLMSWCLMENRVEIIFYSHVEFCVLSHVLKGSRVSFCNAESCYAVCIYCFHTTILHLKRVKHGERIHSTLINKWSLLLSAARVGVRKCGLR